MEMEMEMKMEMEMEMEMKKGHTTILDAVLFILIKKVIISSTTLNITLYKLANVVMIILDLLSLSIIYFLTMIKYIVPLREYWL